MFLIKRISLKYGLKVKLFCFNDSLTPLAPYLNLSSSDMMQWSILAIKNLCEDNLSNQQFIRRLEHQGLSSSNNELLKQNNIEARLENGKITISNVITP